MSKAATAKQSQPLTGNVDPEPPPGLLEQVIAETPQTPRYNYEPAFGRFAEIEKLGRWLHASGSFGIVKPEQGIVLALRIVLRGEDPFDVMNENMFVENRLVRKYEMLLADLRAAGGDFRWIENGDASDQAVIEIVWRGKTSQYPFTMEMAKTAGLVKDGSGWTKRKGNMLRSKCARNGMQMFCPELLRGRITPEDAEEIASESSTVDPSAKKKQQADRAAELKALADAATPTPATPPTIINGDGKEIQLDRSLSQALADDEPPFSLDNTPSPASTKQDAPKESASTPTRDSAPDADGTDAGGTDARKDASPAPPTDGPATMEQFAEYDRLCTSLGFTKLEAADRLKKACGVDRPNKATYQQVAAIIKRCRQVYAEKNSGQGS